MRHTPPLVGACRINNSAKLICAILRRSANLTEPAISVFSGLNIFQLIFVRATRLTKSALTSQSFSEIDNLCARSFVSRSHANRYSDPGYTLRHIPLFFNTLVTHWVCLSTWVWTRRRSSIEKIGSDWDGFDRHITITMDRTTVCILCVSRKKGRRGWYASHNSAIFCEEDRLIES